MSAKSSIQVCIKVRPCEPELSTLWQVKDRRAIQLIDSQADPCVFDYVFDQDSNNQMVFECMAKHIVEACMKGFNGTIFAYGQTSSGKTYTMMGDEHNPGVMVLAAKEIFQQISKSSDRDYLLRVGFIEIYNEKIYDLLNKKNQDLKIHESNGMVNVNCEECIITCEEDLLQFLCMGNKERTVGETNMNERSSRSHAIFRIIIESRKTDRSDDDAVIQSLLNLVDLAGSERADQTGARGARLKEGGHINKSLHFLSNVIKSLSENEDNKYVSFRDSKLTRILQASLGGNAFTSIICNIRPSIMEESQSTLNFAMRAKKIRLKPQRNEIVSDATMMKRLEREIKELKDRLAEEQRRNESQLKVKLLEQRIKTDTLKIISCNTITDKRKNRRRTWCPASSNEELTGSSAPVAEPNSNGSKQSNLPKPSFYPTNLNKNLRPFNAPKTVNIMKSLGISEDEEFKPAVNHDFGEAPNPMTTSRILPPILLTPTVAQLGAKSKEMLERELIELHNFTKMEQHIDSEWEDLEEKLSKASATIDELQSEKQHFQERNASLQDELDALGKAKEASDNKVKEYEEQVKNLKDTVQLLEMESRAAVEIEFEFESHKTKSKLRENELLSVLTEKESAIDMLQKSLDELSKDVLRNSKEEHMRSMCPEIESSCERICNKCTELERLLDEYNKGNQGKSNGEGAHTAIDCECEQLRLEIAKTREQLESVQNAYKQMSSDIIEQSELCERLNRDIISTAESKSLLQLKYDDLELAQQRHEQLMQTMQSDYDAIQEKYERLQQEYKLKQRNTASTEEEYQKLQTENVQLQQEIKTLKQNVEQMQEKLLATATEANEADLEQLKTQNEQLTENLMEMEVKFGELQLEYDALSNQLMESVQDGDSLRDEYNALKDQLQQQQKDAKSQDDLREHIAKLEIEVTEKSQLLEATEQTINEMRIQMTNLESELLEKSVIVNKVDDYQRQIESLEKQRAEMTIVCEELQEKVKENTISESLSMSQSNHTLNGQDNSVQEQDQQREQELQLLREKQNELNMELLELQAEVKSKLSIIQHKDVLIVKMQTELQDLNERCLNVDVLQMELQRQDHEKQLQLDRLAEKLQHDASRIDHLQQCNAQLAERTIKAEEAAADLEDRITRVGSTDSIDIIKQQYEEQVEVMKDSLEKAKTDYASQEKQLKNELDSVKLEFLQKIESSEARYRENLRKYNMEWEDKLQKQISLSEKRCEELAAEAESELSAVKVLEQEMQELYNEKQELESLYDQSQKLVKTLEKKLINKVQHSEQEENDKLQELHKKCAQQIRDYEILKTEHELSLSQLKQEKNNLEDAIEDRQSNIELLNKELQAVQADRQNLLHTIEANAIEKAAFEEKIETLTCKLSDLKEELSQSKLEAKNLEELLNEHEKLKSQLDEANETIKKSTEKAAKLVENLSLTHTELTARNAKLKELEKLEAQLDDANKNYKKSAEITAKVLIDLSMVQTELTARNDQLKQFEDLESQLAAEKENSKNSAEKTSELLNQLAVAKAELKARNDKLKELENLESQLDEAIDINKKSAEQVAKLLEDLSIVQTELTAKNVKVEQMEEELERTLLIKANAFTDQTRLSERLQQLEIELSQQAQEFEQKINDVQSSKDEVQFKLDSLEITKQELETTNHQLTVKLKNELNVQILLEKERQHSFQIQQEFHAKEVMLQQQFTQLEATVKSATTESNKRELELNSQLKSLQTEVNCARSLLKTTKGSFNDDRKRLNDTISSLLEDKRNLEEKLCTSAEIIKKLEIELRSKGNSSNLSFESNTSHTSPVARKSLDRQLPRKSGSVELEGRKNRRISTHDERRQSYWNDWRHVACMTEPVDNNCNCAELDLKLKDCQRALFIQESKVTALNIELKNHPLKDENAQLKKRLQEENQKSRDEVKRLRSKNIDLMSKISYLNENVSKSSETARVQTTISVGTQTESDLETTLKKTNDKLNDCMQICRHRYAHIKELEGKIKQGENGDSSDVSSQTAGQITALTAELEALKKDMLILANKYEFAKKALKLRKDEMDLLRGTADNANPPSST